MATADDVTWEQALDFTLLEQRVGALPWHIDDAVILEMRAELAPSFRKYHSDWPLVRNKVLRIARYQGALAALIQEIADGPATAPGWVSFAALQMAFWIVQLACPTEGAVPETLRGRHCDTPALANVDRALAARLRRLVEGLASPQDWKHLLG